MIQEALNSFDLHLEFLRRLVSDLDDTQMVAQPPNMPNHPAWTIGHLAFSLQQIAGECGLSPWLPDDWAAKFGTGSEPTSETDTFPHKATLLQRLEDSKQRLFSVVQSLGEVGLANPLPDVRYRDRFPTIGHAVVHILSGHTALHLGQLTVWRRLIGLGVSAEPSNQCVFVVTPEDPTSPDAARLISGLTAELFGQYDHAQDGTGDFRPEETLPRSVFLVGRVGSEPVACGAIRPLEGDVAEVKRMFVEPKYRGRGYSEQLLLALEEAARNMEYVALRLETGGRQHAAIGLYEKAGFHRIEPFGIYAGSQQSVCFEKQIASSNVLRDGTTIIPMATKHVPNVIELWEATEGLILTRTDNTADLDAYFRHNPEMSYVAIRARKVVGAVLCGHDGRRGYLHHLAVAEAVRNHGIGRALVNACLSRLRELGIQQCNLFVIDSHAEGRAFWTNDGWEEWADIRLMSKVIQSL